jgi:hypothetical protein
MGCSFGGKASAKDMGEEMKRCLERRLGIGTHAKCQKSKGHKGDHAYWIYSWHRKKTPKK